MTTSNSRWFVMGFLFCALLMYLYFTSKNTRPPRRVRQMPVKQPLDADFREDVPA